MSQKGRDLVIKMGDGEVSETFTPVGGLLNASISGSNGTLESTNFDDDGVRKLIEGRFGMAWTVSGSGVANDTAGFGVLRDTFNSAAKKNYQFVNIMATGGATYEGAFIMTSFEETGETDGYVNFSITLESAGEVTIS